MRTFADGARNLVLTGMPGCGKTTAGRAVAQALGRRFIDMDEAVEKLAGMPVWEIFRRDGEERFRALERDVAAEAGKETRVVIATGGGTVLNEANRAALRRGGRVYYLERAVDRLERAGRPLSTGLAALEAMYRERLPLYLAFADATVTVAEDAAVTAERIAREYIGFNTGQT